PRRRDPRHRRRRDRGAGGARSRGRHRHARARPGRAHAGALRGPQGRHQRDGGARGAVMPSIAVEPWAPEFGAPVDAALTASDAAVDVGVEVAAGAWEPRDPSPAATVAACAVFVDGIRRVDARVWLTGDVGRPVAGLCGSYAAGVVRCDTSGRVERAEVRRVLLAVAGAP